MKDVELNSSLPSTLLLEKHCNYLKKYEEKKDDYDYCMVEFLRMSGVYWGLTAMDLMHKLEAMDRQEVIKYVKSCQDPETGGFGASVGHDPHLLYTLSAVQIVVLLDVLDTIDTEGVVRFVAALQQPDGSFAGDKWGETDTRLSFCAVACLALLKRLDDINVDKVVEYIVSCKNFDGGFGTKPGSESHAGLIYCCVGVLSITRNLDKLDPDLLGWWLSERQLPSGGLNGRPEKLPDVCYSWWVLSSLTILGRLHWLDKSKLNAFILACQDNETGGFSDRPGDMVDPYHTLFGLAGISLLGGSSLKKVNPVFCLPQYVIDRLGIETEILSV